MQPQQNLTEVDTEEMVLFKSYCKRTYSCYKSTREDDQTLLRAQFLKLLRDRADERRQKMKAFNYKFNTSKVEEFEKEPAYKRQGIELSDTSARFQ